MSVFAAILTLDGHAPPTRAESNAVASVLAALAGSEVRAWPSAGCELLVAPLHPWESREPLTVDGGRIAAAGQVTLEARGELARTLQAPASAPDLEIVAAAFDRWGAGCVHRLRGEYAYGVWNTRERRLTCARDPLGIRPLYVGRSTRVVVVSNVIDAVVAHPAMPDDLDRAALARFLARGVSTSIVATPYRAVRMVPEGHTLTIGGSGPAILSRHWQPPPPRHAGRQTDESVMTGYRDVLREAVRDRIGGRRCTVFLSGGMDSTSLAATGVECAADMRAVTFAYRLVETGSEVEIARSVAARLSLPLWVVDGDADVALEAERIGEVPALPVDEPALTNWRAGLRAAAEFSTLAMYGEDGDALFAPPGGSALISAQSFPSIVRETARSVATRGRLPYLGIRLRERLGQVQRTPPASPAWLTPEARRLADAPEDRTLFEQPIHDLELDPCTGRVWERLLRNVPQGFAIAISPDVTRQRLELTLPLMDTRVIEFVTSVPPIPWCQHKHLARAAFAGRLPAVVLTRPKTPVDGLHEALVDAWRRRHPSVTLYSMAPLVRATDWVEGGRWAHAAAHGEATSTMEAWRVLLLDGWLSRTARKAVPCTT